MSMNPVLHNRLIIGHHRLRARRRSMAVIVACVLACTTLVLPAPVPGAMAQDATPAAESTEVWVETAVPATALPGDVLQTLAVFRVVWDEGAVGHFAEGTPGFGVNCVLEGQWGFRPDQDEAVVRAGDATVLETAPAGAETTLEPGDCAVLRQTVARDERNAGDGPVEFLALALIPDETPPPAGGPEPLEIGPLGYIYAGNWSRTPDGPAAPIRFALTRGTLAPGASHDVAVAAGDALVIATGGALSITADGGGPLVERAVSWTSEMPSPVAAGSETVLATTDTDHLQEGTTAVLRNAGDVPASWWLVTVEPLEELVATPEAPANA